MFCLRLLLLVTITITFHSNVLLGFQEGQKSNISKSLRAYYSKVGQDSDVLQLNNALKTAQHETVSNDFFKTNRIEVKDVSVLSGVETSSPNLTKPELVVAYTLLFKPVSNEGQVHQIRLANTIHFHVAEKSELVVSDINSCLPMMSDEVFKLAKTGKTPDATDLIAKLPEALQRQMIDNGIVTANKNLRRKVEEKQRLLRFLSDHAKKIEAPSASAAAELALAEIYYLAGDRGKVGDLMVSAFETLENSKTKPQIVLDMAIDISTFFRTEGKHELALRWIDKAVDLAPKNSEQIATIIYQKAVIEKTRGDFAAARSTLIPLKGKLQDPGLELRYLSLFSSIEFESGNLEMSAVVCDQIEEIIERRTKDRAIAKNLLAVASAKLFQTRGRIEEAYGNLNGAAKFHKTSMGLFRGIPDPIGEMHQWNNLGVIQLATKQFEEAIDSLENARDLAKFHDPGTLTLVELNLVLANSLRATTTNARNKQAILETSVKKLRQQISLAKESENFQTEFLLNGDLARMYFELRDFDNALSCLDLSDNIATKHNPGLQRWYYHDLRATIYRDQRKTEDSVKAFRNAISEIERISIEKDRKPGDRAWFFEQRAHPYRELAILLTKQNRIDNAFSTLEAAKAQTLGKLLSARLNKQNSGAVATPKSVGEYIQKKPCQFVGFVAGDHELLVVVVGADGNLKTKLLPIGREILAQRCESVLSKLANRMLGYEDELSNMYADLIAPIEDHLQKDVPAIFVPDGPLWNIPFACLQDENGSYLISRFPISIAMSFRTFLDQVKIAESRKTDQLRVLIAGQTKDLKGVAKSANQIATVFPKDNSTTILDKDATKERFKMELENHSFIHFGAHGYFDSKFPLKSFVQLFAKRKTRGRLYADEIANMPLGIRLLFLSACETGKGRLSEGEGKVGLVWASMLAGCPSVIATQWLANDDATTEINGYFYEELKQNSFSEFDKCLQAAQLKYLAKERGDEKLHPYYWACPVLYGSPK